LVRVAESLVQRPIAKAQSARSPGGVMRQATSMLQASAAAAAATPAELETEEEPEVEEKPGGRAADGRGARGQRFASEETTVEESEIEEPSSEQTEGAGEPARARTKVGPLATPIPRKRKRSKGKTRQIRKAPAKTSRGATSDSLPPAPLRVGPCLARSPKWTMSWSGSALSRPSYVPLSMENR